MKHKTNDVSLDKIFFKPKSRQKFFYIHKDAYSYGFKRLNVLGAVWKKSMNVCDFDLGVFRKIQNASLFKRHLYKQIYNLRKPTERFFHNKYFRTTLDEVFCTIIKHQQHCERGKLEINLIMESSITILDFFENPYEITKVSLLVE